ncbi:MAG: hypothetical protein U0793_31185 [Gemmataceae bacterium]
MSIRVLLALGVSLVFVARLSGAETEKNASLIKRLEDKKRASRLEALRELGTAAKDIETQDAPEGESRLESRSP